MSANALAVLEVRGLTKTFARRNWLRQVIGRSVALDAIDLEIAAGSITALVGESGSGKSTLARCLCLLDRFDSGKFWFEGREVETNDPASVRKVLPLVQLIFQDPATAFNPRFTVEDAVAEPLVIQGVRDRFRRVERVLELLGAVKLPVEMLQQPVRELSGGQKQRLAIARALATDPRVIVFDESFSGMDLPLRAAILELLFALQKERALTYLLISHDLGLVARVADQVVVMHNGRIVEQGPAPTLVRAATHPESRRLVDAMLPLEKKVIAQAAGGAR